MKKRITIILAIVLMASTAWADSTQSFAWDANSDSNLTGYRVYMSATSGGPWTDISDLVVCTANDASCCVFTYNAIPDGTWFFIARAIQDRGIISLPSNELTKTYPVVITNPPVNFRFD